MDTKRKKYFLTFNNNLLAGINYYRGIANSSNGFSEQEIHDFNEQLNKAESELESIFRVQVMAAEFV